MSGQDGAGDHGPRALPLGPGVTNQSNDRCQTTSDVVVFSEPSAMPLTIVLWLLFFDDPFLLRRLLIQLPIRHSTTAYATMSSLFKLYLVNHDRTERDWGPRVL